MKIMSRLGIFLPYAICLLFACAYATLSIVRHNHFLSYGFDLGISDQVTWEYSQFQAPVTTIHYYPFTSILTDHIEFIYAPLSIFYWIWNDPRMLLLVQSLIVCFSALPLYFLAKDKKLHKIVCFAILLGYLLFYGVQNALWFDVHSATFAAAFLGWFLYFLEKKRFLWSSIFFALAILSKENIGLLTFLISVIFIIRRRGKWEIAYAILSILYVFAIFAVYFPHFTKLGYEYQNTNGLFSDLRIENLLNSPSKQQVFFVSFASFGMLPLFSPVSLIAPLGDLYSYFVIGNNIKEAQGIFMHYRISLAPLLAWSTVLTIARFRRLSRWYVGVYIVVCALLVQYALHLPLSYLAKSWFWKQPAAVANIDTVLQSLPPDASVVSQNNITPHISHRYQIFTLWPQEREFGSNSPCQKKKCNWFRWGGNPNYLVVDTSNSWDIRHFLENRTAYVDGLQNLEKKHCIKKFKQDGNAILYKVMKNPASV